jgi:hypothetical protein
MTSRSKARDQFNIARAEALNAYAMLEKGLAFIFAKCSGGDVRISTLVMSKIVNTRARNEIVQRAVDMRTVNTFKTFTNSLFALIGQIDGERNKLVHWHVDEKGNELALRPTNLLSDSEDRMTENDIDNLWTKALFLARVIGLLDTHMADWGNDPALHERFLQPLRYPPEPDDRLFQSYKDMTSPPPA